MNDLARFKPTIHPRPPSPYRLTLHTTAPHFLAVMIIFTTTRGRCQTTNLNIAHDWRLSLSPWIGISAMGTCVLAIHLLRLPCNPTVTHMYKPWAKNALYFFLLSAKTFKLQIQRTEKEQVWRWNLEVKYLETAPQSDLNPQAQAIRITPTTKNNLLTLTWNRALHFSVTAQVLPFNLSRGLRGHLLASSPPSNSIIDTPDPKGPAIIILPCGPTLSLPHPTSNMVMINHPTSNRSALLPSQPPPSSSMGSRWLSDVGAWDNGIQMRDRWRTDNVHKQRGIVV